MQRTWKDCTEIIARQYDIMQNQMNGNGTK